MKCKRHYFRRVAGTAFMAGAGIALAALLRYDLASRGSLEVSHGETCPPAPMAPAALFEIYQNDDSVNRMNALLDFAARPRETQRWLEHQLRGEDPAAQYMAARLAGELRQEGYRSALLDLALDRETLPAVRVSACYALRHISLTDRDRAALLEEVGIGTAIVGRAALAALAGKTGEEDAVALGALLRHPDPLTRLYAGRLLLEQGRGPGFDFFVRLAAHKEYRVRQESYDALGYSDADGVDALLEAAVARETNQSSNRAARLALGFHRARRLSEKALEKFFQDRLDNGDDHERLWVLDMLAARNGGEEKTALKKLSEEDSDLGLYCRTRLRLVDMGSETKDPVGARATEQVKHYLPAHRSLMELGLECYHAQADAVPLGLSGKAAILDALTREDFGITPLKHAHNPLTGRGFIFYTGFGGSAGSYSEELLAALDLALSNHNLDETFNLAGRLLHLLEDMSSPAHVFGIWHPFNTCLFEDYWLQHADEIEALPGIGEIVPARASVPSPVFVERLDPFSGKHLQERLADLPDSLYGPFEASAWTTYFTVSHWGELRFDDEVAAPRTLPATFAEEPVEEQDNVLYAMFNGNIRYHTSWWNDYFEIEDVQGHTFTWNKCLVLDGFRPCPNPAGLSSREGHLRGEAALADQTLLRLTGRFYFTQRGFRATYCHPFRHPDGTPAEEHLVRYYGKTLFPMAVGYCAGWFNVLAARAPELFDASPSETVTRESDDPGQEMFGTGTVRNTGITKSVRSLSGPRESSETEAVPEIEGMPGIPYRKGRDILSDMLEAIIGAGRTFGGAGCRSAAAEEGV